MVRQEQQAHGSRSRSQNTVGMDSKACTKCSEVKGRDEFYKRSGDKLYPHCKTCHNKMVRQNHRKNYVPHPRELKVPVECKWGECTKDAVAREVCKRHYYHLIRKEQGMEVVPNGSPVPTTATDRFCRHCDQWRPLNKFHKHNKTGLQNACNDCQVRTNAFNRFNREKKYDRMVEVFNNMPPSQQERYQERFNDILVSIEGI